VNTGNNYCILVELKKKISNTFFFPFFFFFFRLLCFENKKGWVVCCREPKQISRKELDPFFFITFFYNVFGLLVGRLRGGPFCLFWPDHNVHTLRGTGGENQKAPGIIMCEEMGFMNEALYDVIFPLIGRDKASLIGITTMDDIFNPVNQLFELRDEDNEPLFNVITFDFVCQDCKDAGLELDCKHRLGELPPWLSATQVTKLRKMYAATSNEKQYLAEILGILSDDTKQPVFEKEDIDWFVRNIIPAEHRFTSQQNIWVACDPYAGGKLSDYAVVSMIKDGEDYVVSNKEKKKVFVKSSFIFCFHVVL